MKKDRTEIIKNKLKDMKVYGWIFDDLKLSGNEAFVYAALYATKSMRIKVSESDVIFNHLRICESTFYKLRDKLDTKKGLIDVTGDGKEKYYCVVDPTNIPTVKKAVAAESAVKVEREGSVTEDDSSKALSMEKITRVTSDPKNETNVSSQLGLFGSGYDNVIRPCNETGNMNETVEANIFTQQVPEVATLPRQEEARENRTGQVTKEKFCETFQVTYDGTEDTEGVDWDRLYRKFEESKKLRGFFKGQSLKVILGKLQRIYDSHMSDEEVKKEHKKTVSQNPPHGET
ncbi:MAG: hypothetical protein LUD29_04840 [Clostridia bacterium]|nr:hypothetical protein [Clostridia bacterium]